MTIYILLSAGQHPASDERENDSRGSGSDWDGRLRLHMCPRRWQAGASAPGFYRQSRGVYPFARVLMRYSETATMAAPIIMDKSGSNSP